MDYLEVDKEIPDQKYSLVSFLCPDSEIKKREFYMLEKFREYYFDKIKESYTVLEEGLQDNAVLLERLREIQNVQLAECFENFQLSKKKELDVEYDEKNQNKCSILGLKIRGSFPSVQEAKSEAAKKQKLDPNHNIFICQTGYWVPFSPNIEEIKDQEYACEKLNELMKEYSSQLEHKNEVWNALTKERIKRAQEEGQFSRKESGKTDSSDTASSSSS